jgi:hypothetical protein
LVSFLASNDLTAGISDFASISEGKSISQAS